MNVQRSAIGVYYIQTMVELGNGGLIGYSSRARGGGQVRE
jgi:hypothetical protein